MEYKTLKSSEQPADHTFAHWPYTFVVLYVVDNKLSMAVLAQ